MNTKGLIDENFKAALFFGSESIQFLMVYCLAISSLWLWIPIGYFIKWILTTFIILNFYTIARHFIYVRYVLWKENRTL